MRFIKSQKVSQQSVESALEQIIDPVSGKSLPSSGRIESLMVSKEGQVILTLLGQAGNQDVDERLRYEVEQTLQSIKRSEMSA